MIRPLRRPPDDRHLATLGRLTRGALHELANPLLALVGTADFALAEAEQGTKLHERLTTVRATAAEIAEIVRALQGFARLGHESPRQLSLVGAADEAAALVRLVAAAPDLSIDVRADAQPRVHEAPGVVVRALVDLLLDAVAATERGRALELVVREDGAEAVAAVAAAGEIRFSRVDAAA